MVLLRTAPILLLLTACYSPDVRDCTVACSRATDCAPDQICGGDGFCAAEAVAGSCGTIAATDAGIDGRGVDARADAPPPLLDAWPTVTLWTRLDGRGVVSVAGTGDCDGGSGAAECMFQVKQAVAITLHATPKNNWRFVRWDDACANQPTATCVVTPTAATDVRARFELVDD